MKLPVQIDRLTQLKRVIRALVKPDIIEYELDISVVEIPFYLPCPEGEEISAPDLDQSQPYMLASAYCASPQEIVQVTGKNFPPNTKGPVDFYTSSGVKKPWAISIQTRMRIPTGCRASNQAAPP